MSNKNTGSTKNHESCGEPKTRKLDGLVEGTSGDDTIDIAYSGDPEGDRVDNSDNIFSSDPEDSEDDIIKAYKGDDLILSGEGRDRIFAGKGNDTVLSGNGIDFIDAGAGNDAVFGGDHNDKLLGGAGNDKLDGGVDDDLLYGGVGDDRLIGGRGVDTVFGGDGRDSIIGSDIGDRVDGGGGPPGKGSDGLPKDYDTLDLTDAAPPGGSLEVTYTSPDEEDGFVEYFDDSGALLGTSTFHDIEKIVGIKPPPPICFTPGTAIATPTGERLIEDLRPGDRVITRDNGLQTIHWIGSRDLTGHQLARAPHMCPILIQAGSLGANLPEQDILLSPQHRVLLTSDRAQLYFEEREVLVAAKHLTHLDGIDEVGTLGVTYIHFMFERHEVVLTNGAWTESFQPGEQSMDGLGEKPRSEIFELFPELKTTEGLQGYRAARRSLKKHEAKLLSY